HGFVMSELLHVTRIERSGETDKLIATIIDIEFTLDSVAGGFQDVSKGIAQHAVACAAIVDRACRVGAEVLNLPMLPMTPVNVTYAIAGPYHCDNLLLEPLVRQP